MFEQIITNISFFMMGLTVCSLSGLAKFYSQWLTEETDYIIRRYDDKKRRARLIFDLEKIELIRMSYGLCDHKIGFKMRERLLRMQKCLDLILYKGD